MTAQDALNLAIQHHQAGRLAEAETIYRQILRQFPTHVEAMHLLGVAASQTKRYELAMEMYRRALALNPSHAECRANLGLALAETKHYREAIVEYSVAIKLKPEFVQAHGNLASALAETGKMDAAVETLRQALKLQPDFAQGRFNLGNTLFRMGRLEEAIANFRRAVALVPNWREAENNLANVLCARGQFDEAEGIYRGALARRPDDPLAHWNLGLNLLRRGELRAGLEKYEWRLKLPELGMRTLTVAKPRWDGSPLNGRRILIHNEQGLGDTIQFVRYVPRIAERGGKVILRCQPELAGLLSGFAGVEQLITAADAVPECDVYCPLPSLPGVFGTTLADVPAEVPYLAADAGLREKWRERLAANSTGKVKVGLCWAGRPTHPHDRLRSLQLAILAPLAGAAGARFISLQKGEAAAQVRAAPFAIEDWMADLADFSDTAAVVANLDVVITVDTSVAHLAGAMGKAVWVLLPFVPDWRWMLRRADSPWYPTMRLFRQASYDDWSTPIDHVAEVLQHL